MPGVAPARRLTVPLGLMEVILIDSEIWKSTLDRYLSYSLRYLYP